jgi:quinol monooxygenase YgiN
MENTDIVFMTTARSRLGREAEVQRALRDVAQAARAQPGCVEYLILRSAAEPAVTINAERWETEAQREAFLAGPAVETFSSAVSGAFAEPPQPMSYRVLEQA